jgi:hypothetical protein
VNVLASDQDPKQVALLRVIWDEARFTGRWPTFDFVERTLYQQDDLHARDILPSLPFVRPHGSPGGYGLVWTPAGAARTPSPDDETALTLAGLRSLPEAVDFVELVCRLISALSARERAIRPDAAGVARDTFSCVDLAAFMRPVRHAWPPETTALLRTVLQHEPATAGSIRELDGGEWEIDLQPVLRRFADLDSVDDYLDRVLALLSPADGVTPPAIADAFAESSIWPPGQLRVFLSHLASHRAFVSEISTELRAFGVYGFVAHDNIEVSAEWQAVIEEALRTAEALVGLAHPGFSDSHWVQQELGWAYGRGLPVAMVRLGEDPRGFPAKWQWPSLVGAPAVKVAGAIAAWLNRHTDLGARLGDAAIVALREAGSYDAAKQAAEKVEAFGRLTEPQLNALADVYLANNQVHGSVIASPVVKRIFAAHGRPLPKRPGAG